MVGQRLQRKFIVRVPATCANLGPGFDCLGMALDLWNELTLEGGQGFSISVTGEGAAILPNGREGLIYRAMEALCRQIGKPVPPFCISCHNQIPLARGLGSSAAAVVGGLVAANFFYGNPVSRKGLLSLGTRLEGHPDNVAPALFGGCQVVVDDEGRLVQARVSLPRDLRATVFIPEKELLTADSRAVLPSQVSRGDAVYNLGRVALLVTSLARGRLDLLKIATQDRLHQPSRQALFPAMGPLFQAALEAGALGVFLSGSGPAVLALGAEDSAGIGHSMERTAADIGLQGKTIILRPSARGAFVRTIKPEVTISCH